ncbi:hypothetical protein P168DRAFT_126405 [Aspergillus campestris IBT 28561]|uniref:Uncharacterized protein n=1 Tax=Aspergillus campestris (strain IBT 28561) TaxID=1392248 RepID=A0A2I1D6Q0_ASPC2|nr:uncharacterized protein P168DRAFT_126405 [Aspergillus campestris IBT 28561]PKY05550.1 hypothetical protein P168DRAFT_126405 [Aspergillus campestris IBT 28561]
MSSFFAISLAEARLGATEDSASAARFLHRSLHRSDSRPGTYTTYVVGTAAVACSLPTGARVSSHLFLWLELKAPCVTVSTSLRRLACHPLQESF